VGGSRAAPGLEPFDDWVIMRMEMAALALPDVTMCRGTYPVPVGRPYVSGQEGVGMIEDAAPSQAAGFLIASHTAYHAAIRRGSRLSPTPSTWPTSACTSEGCEPEPLSSTASYKKDISRS
jgi:hypothetical protein